MAALAPLLLLALALLAPALADQVCYDGLGCFDNSGVWASHGLPQPPEELATRFLLYTRNANYEHEIMFNKTDMLQFSDFNATRQRTIAIIHGFADSCNEVWPIAMKTALLAKEDANLLCVDWNFGSSVYLKARDNARLLGAQGERMFRWLGTEAGLQTSQLYLIGHDVGAHAASYISTRLGGVPRITGLDPAALDFDDADTEVRLDASDATLVDVVHTDAAGSDALGLGVTQESGSVSFRPNSGAHQPGCMDDIGSYIQYRVHLRTLKISKAEWLAAACSHFRSIDLFMESITSNCGFVAVPCDSWDALVSGDCPMRCRSGKCQNLGLHADRHSNTGTFFLFTKATAPFCDAFFTIEVVMGSSQSKTYGTLTAKILGEESRSIILHHGGFYKHDVFHSRISGADPGAGDLLVELTYTRESSIFYRYTTTLELESLAVSAMDGDMHLRTFRSGVAVLETGVATTLRLTA